MGIDLEARDIVNMLHDIEEHEAAEWVERHCIARHLGAGQPVESDRAALVERMCTAFDEQIEYGYTAIALDFATIALEVIEAAGWGPRAEPVAPPEPLSAEEIEAMARKVGDQEMRQWFRQGGGQNDQTDIVRFVLAALPERFPVPVERA